MPERKPPEEDEGPSKAWMESYADAMTLLLAFFIMMFAFALVDETKFFDFKVGMVQALGISDPIEDDSSGMLLMGEGIAEVPGTMAVPIESVRERLTEADEALGGEVTPENAEELRLALEQALDALGAGDDVSVDLDERGVVMRFDARVLFPSGSAQLNADAPVTLGQAGTVLALVDNNIDVEGHTDSVPTRGTQWPTNWELSAARATTVVRYFSELAGLPAPRLAATGHADTRPRASNSTEEGRQQNRRVEVVVLVSGMVADGSPAQSIDPGVGTATDIAMDTGIDPGISTGIANPALDN